MELTPEQIKLIRNSWRGFRNISPNVVGDLFYSKLFSDSPALRKMFPAEMGAQHIKLVDMLTTMVMRLDQPAQFEAELIPMAKRHAGYGVKPAHYKSVGEALLWTLQKASGETWNKDLEQAWTNCYWQIADMMIDQSAQPAANR